MTPIHSDVKTILGNKLHKVVKENKTAEAIATALATRVRVRGFTDINRLKLDLAREGFDMNDKDTEHFFKVLENEGYGSIVRSREFGGRPRFLWKYDMRKVANAAIHGNDLLAEELAPKFRRGFDAPRKKGPTKIATKVVKEENTNPVAQINLNGTNYIAMQVEEYNELKKLKEIIKMLK